MVTNGLMGAEVSHRVGEVDKVFGALRNVWKERSQSLRAKMGKFDGIIVLLEQYECEARAINKM